MIDVLEKLDELSRKISTNNRKTKQLGSPKSFENKQKLRNLHNKYYERLIEFKAICTSVIDNEKTIYDMIREKVIETYNQDKTFFVIVKPPTINDLNDVKEFDVTAMSHGGLWVSLDGEKSLLPLFSDIGKSNLDKLGRLFEEETRR